MTTYVLVTSFRVALRNYKIVNDHLISVQVVFTVVRLSILH